MKQIKTDKQDKVSNKLETLLTNAGVSKRHALVITCLLTLKEASVQKIIEFTGLVQPEISVITIELEKNGIINYTLSKTPSKGRPYKTYSMILTLDQLASKLEAPIKEKIKSNKDAIKRLKENQKPN